MSRIRHRTSLPDRAAFNAYGIGSRCAQADAVPSRRLLAAGLYRSFAVSAGTGASREAAFVFAVCGSAAVYVLTFYGVGVASDFRYGYWAVLAAIAGGVVLLSGKGGGPAPNG